MRLKLIDGLSLLIVFLGIIIFVITITDAKKKGGCKNDDECPKHQCCLTAPTSAVKNHCSNFTGLGERCSRRTPLYCGCYSHLKCQAHTKVKPTDRLKMFAICERVKKSKD